MVSSAQTSGSHELRSGIWSIITARRSITALGGEVLQQCAGAGIDRLILRHTFASRMSAAGVSDLFVGQIIGHKTPGILQKYSRAIDEYRRPRNEKSGSPNVGLDRGIRRRTRRRDRLAREQV